MESKKDYSFDCNKDDEDLNNNCLNCYYFSFPIGCMYSFPIRYENKEEK